LYRRFVEGIKERIRTAQLKAALAANAELVSHYWESDAIFSPTKKVRAGARRSSIAWRPTSSASFRSSAVILHEISNTCVLLPLLGRTT
jgi:hypothetical protein